jgi:hypothetical protein
MLADDRDAVGVSVLDQRLTIPVENQAPRSAQSQRPLVVVLSHFQEGFVLDDLQHPEAHGQNREGQRDHELKG